MKNRPSWLRIGGLLAGATAVVALADPIPFPESGTFETDFEDDPEGAGWTLEGWVWDLLQVGVEEMSATGGGDGQVSASDPGGLDDFEFAEDGVEFPFPPLVAPGSYSDLGFSGENWLVNSAGIPDEEGLATGSALLEFTDLPAHSSVSIAMKLGAGGSWDGDDGPFDILVDGTPVLSHQFNSGGGNFDAGGVEQLATGANLTALYRERWNDNGGTGPKDKDDRFAHGWILDSAYDITAMSNLTEIPHTSDTLSIEFLHHLNSGVSDEHVAIDDLKVSLGLEVILPPNEWPGGDTFTEDFSAISKAWSLRQWSTPEVFSGATEMTGTGNGPGLIRRTDNNNGLAEESFSNGEPVYPLAPLTEAQDLKSLDARFDGRWLQSSGSGTRDGTATLFFENLPPHDGIDVDFVLAATDSFDGDDVIPDSLEGGNFQMVLDGEVVYETRFPGAGGLVEELASGANLSPNYREAWNGDSEVGPIDAEDRAPIGWTLDSAYDYTAFFDEDGENPIAHTSDKLTLSFVHGLSSGADDEGISVDGFQLKLLNVTSAIPFEITSITLNPETNAVTLEWNAKDGESYTVQRTFDLLSAASGVSQWDEQADGNETGTYVDTQVPDGTREAYYRVIQEERQ